MNPNDIVDAASRLAGVPASDFNLAVQPNNRPLWATYKRGLLLALREAGCDTETIMRHVAYSPNTIDRSSYRWKDEPKDAAACAQILAAVRAKMAATPKAQEEENPRKPRSMGDFGVYYGRRSASGGSSLHLMTREEAGR